MKRRLQFSVATLLVIVAACAIGSHWYATKYRADEAREELNYERDGRDIGVATDDDVYAASVKLLDARQRVPFSNRRDAYAEHLEAMENLERKWRNLPMTGTYGGSKDSYDDDEWTRECNEKADKIHVWVEEAQRWLDEAS